MKVEETARLFTREMAARNYDVTKADEVVTNEGDLAQSF